MKMKFILLLFATTVFSCGDDTTLSSDATDNTDTPDETEAPISNPPNVLGMDYTKSKVSVDDTYAALRSSLEANPNISIVAEVDHQANAASVDQELNPTKIIFFGNPNLGTPLMQKNQLAGLNLPQKKWSIKMRRATYMPDSTIPPTYRPVTIWMVSKPFR